MITEEGEETCLDDKTKSSLYLLFTLFIMFDLEQLKDAEACKKYVENKELSRLLERMQSTSDTLLLRKGLVVLALLTQQKMCESLESDYNLIETIYRIMHSNADKVEIVAKGIEAIYNLCDDVENLKAVVLRRDIVRFVITILHESEDENLLLSTSRLLMILVSLFVSGHSFDTRLVDAVLKILSSTKEKATSVVLLEIQENCCAALRNMALFYESIVKEQTKKIIETMQLLLITKTAHPTMFRRICGVINNTMLKDPDTANEIHFSEDHLQALVGALRTSNDMYTQRAICDLVANTVKLYGPFQKDNTALLNLVEFISQICDADVTTLTSGLRVLRILTKHEDVERTCAILTKIGCIDVLTKVLLIHGGEDDKVTKTSDSVLNNLFHSNSSKFWFLFVRSGALQLLSSVQSSPSSSFQSRFLASIKNFQPGKTQAMDNQLSEKIHQVALKRIGQSAAGRLDPLDYSDIREIVSHLRELKTDQPTNFSAALHHVSRFLTFRDQHQLINEFIREQKTASFQRNKTRDDLFSDYCRSNRKITLMRRYIVDLKHQISNLELACDEQEQVMENLDTELERQLQKSVQMCEFSLLDKTKEAAERNQRKLEQLIAEKAIDRLSAADIKNICLEIGLSAQDSSLFSQIQSADIPFIKSNDLRVVLSSSSSSSGFVLSIDAIASFFHAMFLIREFGVMTLPEAGSTDLITWPLDRLNNWLIDNGFNPLPSCSGSQITAKRFLFLEPECLNLPAELKNAVIPLRRAREQLISFYKTKVMESRN